MRGFFSTSSNARGTTMSDEIIDAIDWRGAPVDCSACAHRDLLAAGKCKLRCACVHDRYARRIDRFFDWNRKLADRYVTHPHFEVRAIAAKSADQFLLPALLNDADETVRWNAVLRLPYRYMLKLRGDPHREVRVRVASRLDPLDLPLMLGDVDYYVRRILAQRIAPDILPLMASDPEVEVRRVVARRIGEAWLMRMATDPDAGVRLEAARRLGATQLIWLLGDPDWRVRHEVATRVDRERLRPMRDDPDPLVREVASRRLGARLSQLPQDGKEQVL
jgi:HEAT repeat protein